MITVRIENSSNPVVWQNEWPVSRKETGHGIGLLNVKNCVEKYNGDMKLSEEDGLFVAEIFLNN